MSEKNINKGTVSAGRDAIIGDNNTINNSTNIFNQRKLPKNSKALMLKMPKLRQDQIIGRGKDLDDLHQRLFDSKQVVLMNGMGGIGKTTLAQVYLSKYYEAYRYVAWVSQSSGDVISDFINTEGLLARLDIERSDKTPQQLFHELMMAIRELEGSPCLLVIDNATTQLEEFYTYLPSQPDWHILVTSRQRIEGFDVKTLGFLSEAEAIALFKSHYTRDRLSEEFLAHLVKTLEYHTLTIEILAKTAQEQRTAPDTLLTALEHDLAVDTKVRHSSDPIEKIRSYLCSIFKIANLSEAEQWLLKQFLCLPPDAHSYDLLDTLIQPQEYEGIDNLSKLLDSLSHKGWLLHQTETDSYKLHRIIADVVREELPLVESDIIYLIDAISSQLYLDDTKDNPIDKFEWIPFGKALLNSLERIDSKKYENKPANYFDKRVLYFKRFIKMTWLWKMYIFFFSTIKNITILQNNLALVLQALGDYEGAKVLLEKAMDSDEENFGKKHPSTAVSYSNLALVLQALGDYEGAKVLLEKAMDSDEENFGKKHPSTAVSYSNLALVLQALGDYEEAKVLLEKAMRSNEQNFREQHPTTAINYSNLGLVLKDLGDYEEAKLLLEKAMHSDEQNFGEEHPTTAISYSNLGLVLQALGDYEEAKVLLEKAMRSNEQNFREQHPTTAISYSNLATVLKDLGDYGGAKVLLEKAMRSNEENFGKKHPSTARSYSNLGLVFKDLGDYEGAKVLLEKAIYSDEQNFGEAHPTTAISYSNLATVFFYLSDYKSASVLLEKAYKVYVNRLGEEHPTTKVVKGNLDTVLSHLK